MTVLYTIEPVTIWATYCRIFVTFKEHEWKSWSTTTQTISSESNRNFHLYSLELGWNSHYCLWFRTSFQHENVFLRCAPFLKKNLRSIDEHSISVDKGRGRRESTDDVEMNHGVNSFIITFHNCCFDRYIEWLITRTLSLQSFRRSPRWTLLQADWLIV